MKRPGASPLECLAGHYLEGQVDECWLWHGALTWKGYGSICHAGQTQHAHRVAYLAFVGPIPEGLTVHHLCHERRCVNPHHLEVLDPVSHGLLHCPQSIEDHCKNGHPWTPANTRLRTKRSGLVVRVCRACDAAHHRARYHAVRDQA